MSLDFNDMPDIAIEFLNYMLTIKNISKKMFLNIIMIYEPLCALLKLQNIMQMKINLKN